MTTAPDARAPDDSPADRALQILRNLHALSYQLSANLDRERQAWRDEIDRLTTALAAAEADAAAAREVLREIATNSSRGRDWMQDRARAELARQEAPDA